MQFYPVTLCIRLISNLLKSLFCNLDVLASEYTALLLPGHIVYFNSSLPSSQLNKLNLSAYGKLPSEADSLNGLKDDQEDYQSGNTRREKYNISL